MKINQIIQETTTAGSSAPTEHAFVKMQTRNPSVYGDQKVGSLFKGKKTNKPFANSINEGAVKQYSMDLKELTDEEFKKKYKKTKQEARKAMKEKPEPVNEAHLEEDDIIVVPGQGRLKKTGFVKHDPDRAEHEGETLKNSLHTIIRVASELDKQLSTRDNFPEWVSEKVGTVKSMMVSVADYLTSSKEMQGVAEAEAPLKHHTARVSYHKEGDPHRRYEAIFKTTHNGGKEETEKRAKAAFSAKKKIVYDIVHEQGVAEGSKVDNKDKKK
jgi:hypothetical protein